MTPNRRVVRALASVRNGVLAPAVAMRRTARDPVMLRVQLAWAAVMVASWAATVSLTVVAWNQGGSVAVAAAVIARAAPGLAAGPVIGRVVDHVDRQRCLFWAALLSGLGSVGAAVAGEVLVAVVALSALVALCTMLFRTAQSVILTELVDEPEDLTTANVLTTAIESFGVFAGPALAGLLLAVQGPEASFGAAAALYVGAVLLVVGLRGRAVPLARDTSVGHGGLRALLRHRTARLLFAITSAQTLVGGGLIALYPSLAVAGLGADVSVVGLLTAAFGLGGVLASLGLFALAGTSRLGVAQAWSMLLWSVPLLLLPFAPGVPVVVALLLLVGAGNALFDVTVVTLLQRGLPAPLLGRAFGTLESVVVIGTGAGAALAPVLDRLFGPSVAIAVLASPLLVLTVLVLRPLRRLDRDLAAPSRQVALLRGIPVFALLPTLTLERLALSLRRLEVDPGIVVVHQGEPGTTWFVVDSGRLSVAVDDRPVVSTGAGEAFGEIALLRGGMRTATVTAITPTVLWTLEGAVFLAALRVEGGLGLTGADLQAAEHLGRAAPANRVDPSPGRATVPGSSS